MEDSYGNYSVGSVGGREVAPPVVYVHPGESGGRGDTGSRGSHGNHRGYRRGGSYQRGRNFVDSRPNNHEHPQFVNARRHVEGHGGGVDGIPNSPQSGESFTGEREGRGRGFTGPLRFNSNNFRGGRAVSHDNTHDYRSFASGESSFDGNRERWSVSEAAPAGESRNDDQQGGHLENQDHRSGEQQRRFGESNRFAGHRRGSGAGRGQRFNKRASLDGSHGPQTSRRGGISYHEVEDGRRLDRGGRGRHDENRDIVVANSADQSEDSEHGSAGPLAHLEPEIPQASSTMSNNYGRDGNWPEFFGEVEYDSRPGSSSSDNVPFSENAGRAYGGDSGGGRGRRENYRENRKADGPSVIQGHRRDYHQTTGRKKAVVQADNGEALWRAKKSQVPQLVQELEERLTRGTIECMICYDMVGRSSPMWSCGSCYAIFHLNCIKRWARAPTSTDLSVSSANHSLEGNWRCPGCQAVELITARDLRYNCFCGQVDNPSVDHYLTPHSCGGPCKKPLDRSKTKRCNHYCTMQCHPGPCPPCSAVAPSECCPCGKKTFTRRCGEQKAISSCGDVCGRKLSCGRHSCSRICHEGSCELCKVDVNTQCFCGKKHETMSCGAVEIQGNVDFERGILSCGGRCSKILSCGNHECQEKCHPGPCGECEVSPAMLQTCPCGKKKLQELVGTGRPRIKCTDPVPTCGQGCCKVLPCKVHVCRDLCHSGPCPPCRVPVEQKCRCGSSSRSVACHVSQGNPFVGEETEGLFLCERKCGQKKSCGRHRCNNRCCPSTTNGASLQDTSDRDPHDCFLACGKKLRCRQHNCQERCHSGHCPPCLESIFTELSCACGKTCIPPPVPCGTPLPSCQEPCSFRQPCGHLATHLCHFGDCPPCTVPVTKECVGNHVLLRGVPCGSRDIKCNKLCGKTRQCGLHACARACHVPPCDNVEDGNARGVKTVKHSCGQPCGAPRRDCSHTCSLTCHPSAPCPDNRCKVVVTITCGCGRISGDVPCDAGGSSTSRASAETEMILSRLPAPLQPITQSSERTPLGQRKLSCDDECGKLEKKRLLADAFGVELSGDFTSGDAGALGSEMLTEMLRRDPQWVLAVEERFRSLLLGPKVANLKVHVFCPMAKEKREVIYQLAERWSLTVSSAGREPRRFPIVHVNNKSKVPYTRMLSKTPLPPAGQQTPPAFNAAVDMEPGLVVAFFDVPREVDMSGLVLRFAGECELVWLNDKNALAIFGDVARAATALRRVDHTTAYKGAISVPGSAVYTSSKGAWGQAAGSSIATKPSAKKKAVLESSWVEDAWGDDNRKSSKEQLTGAWQRKEPSIITKNPWGALEQTRARVSDARLKGCYVSSQPSGTSQASTKEGESSAQGERAKLVKSTSKEGGDQAGPSGASKEVSPFFPKSPAYDSLDPQNGEKDDWERLLD
ncbi:hypothetical protein Mapa_008697 [Marchantia paleacea]|nr:hypothetical protein Mapa_008697 [Marchantia paleacea]